MGILDDHVKGDIASRVAKVPAPVMSQRQRYQRIARFATLVIFDNHDSLLQTN